MNDPWFNPSQFGAWYGAIAGSSIGMLGAIVGTLAEILIPQGKGRVLIPRLMKAAIAICALQLILGAVALAYRQPWGIWYPPFMVGITGTTVFGVLLPRVRRRFVATQNLSQKSE